MTTKYIISYKNNKTNEYTEDSVVYDIKDTDYKTKLYYSESDYNWSDKVIGTKGASLHRKNDDVIIKVDNKKMVLDYAQLEMLFVLLTHENNTETFKTIIGKITNVD